MTMPLFSTRAALTLSAVLTGGVAPLARAAAVNAAPGFLFSTLPFSDTGTTVGKVNDIFAITPGISNFPQVAGPDVFYTFTVVTAGIMSIRLTPLQSGTYDPAIYLLFGGTAGSNAILGRDAFGPGQAEVMNDLPLDVGTYYLVVDSYYATGPQAAGTYTLEITGDLGLASVPEPSFAAFAATAFCAAAGRRRRGHR